MRGQGETFGMGAGASVRKGKTAKQVRRARKNLNAQAKAGSSKAVVKKEPAVKSGKPVMSYGQASKNYSVGKTPAKARQVTPGKPKNYRRSQ